MGNRSFLAAFLLLILSLPAAAGVGVWTPLGPDGGLVRALAVDPADPEVVYAGTSNGVFKSVDGGETWTASSAGIPVASLSVAALLVRPGAVFAGTEVGIVYKSTDGGATWVRSSKGISPTFEGLGPGIGALLSDPRRPGRIWAGVRHGLFSSTDGGATWRTRFVGDPFDFPLTGVAIDPGNGQIYISSSYRGVYTSTDEGKTWKKVSFDLLGNYYFDLEIDPRTPSILHVGSDVGLWRSENRGGRWQRVPAMGNAPVRALAYQGDRLYAAAATLGIFYSDDQGRTWTPVRDSPENLNLSALAAGPVALYAGTFEDGAAIYRSLDRGETWEAAERGLGALAVHAVAVSPASADVLYASAERGGVFKSTDRGATWQLLDLGVDLSSSLGGIMQALRVDPSNPEVVHAGTNMGGGSLLRSADGGATWAEVLFFVSIEDFATGGDGTAWATGSGLFLLESPVHRSVDSGATWIPVRFPGTKNAWVPAFEADPTNPQVLWAAGGLFEVKGRRSVLSLRIYRSANGGQTWERRESGINVPKFTEVEDLAIDPANPSRLYLATTAGLFRTANAGVTWTRVPAFSNAAALAVETAPTTPTTVYAALAGLGVQRSTDGGATWSAVRQGLGAIPVLDLVVDPTNPRRLYAGTLGRSVLTWEEPVP